MIIEIHSSLVGRMARESSHEGAVAIALDHLANAQREGNHLLFGEIETLEQLRNFQQWLNPRTSATLARTLGKFPQIAHLSKIVCVKMLVGDFDRIEVLQEGEMRVIRYPVEEITSAAVQSTLLLVENITDADFYRWITDEVLAREKMPDFVLKMEPYQGGGNTTADVYEHLKKNSSRPCLCIVDSDIRGPAQRPGETALKVIRSDDTHPSAKADHYVLGSCSIENLVPLELYYEVWKTDKVRQQILAIYTPFYTDDHWPYLQLKKDIRCADLRSETEFSEFWRQHLGCADSVNICVAKPLKDQCTGREKCVSIQLPLFAKKPLDEVLNHLISNAVPYNVPPKIKEVWNEVANRIMSWCCSSAPQAAM